MHERAKMLVDLAAEAGGGFSHTMSNEPNDLALAKRLARGDDAALQELYATYGQRLYAYALRLTDDPALAEDATQEALVAVWKSAGSYRGEGRLLAWLLGIVHHTALKLMRKRPESISPEMEETLETGLPSPEQQTERDDQSRRLQGAMRTLSPEHRAALELVFYQGLSLEEAARVCEVPLGTIKSRLSYARKSLRGVLTRLEETP